MNSAPDDCAGLMFDELQPRGPRVDLHRVTFAEFPFQHAHREWIEDMPLNRAFQRARAVRRIVTFAHEPLFRGVGERDENLPLFEPLEQALYLDVDDGLHLVAAQRMEDDDFVDAIDE